MTLHLKVSGLVQGVFLRAMSREKASSLGLTGWVRNNTSDGTVEIEAQGKEEALEEFLIWLKLNPGSSQIEKIEKKWLNIDRGYKKFEVIY